MNVVALNAQVVAADVDTCSVLARETHAIPIPTRMPHPATSYQKSDLFLLCPLPPSPLPGIGISCKNEIISIKQHTARAIIINPTNRLGYRFRCTCCLQSIPEADDI